MLAYLAVRTEMDTIEDRGLFVRERMAALRAWKWIHNGI